MIKKFSDEQINRARSVTLLDYMRQHNPGCLKHMGGGRYVHQDHDSFVIQKNNSDVRWFWNTKEVGGYSALDYLCKIEGMGFKDAMSAVLDGSDALSFNDIAPVSSKRIPERKPFSLPKAAQNNHRAFAYLLRRGISAETIQMCIDKGLLYQSVSGNCVFVGHDNARTPKYAAERSTTGDIKKDVSGSDKRFSFCIPPSAPSKSLYVFESPIDAMAHRDITEQEGYRLSLGGVVSAALDRFLEDHKDIKTILLCLDNDKAGNAAAKRIYDELKSSGRSYEIKFEPPKQGKDFAEYLQIKQKQKTADVENISTQLQKRKDVAR
ncbi:MAG: DUF3991 and toprim domain-containing protein [Clostridiales bacterium]|jgi:hypothetical protein|nr:DUF3991 and toprim domain-containing protein [Clostridiales bacterium]